MRELLGQFVTFAAISVISIGAYAGWKELKDSEKKHKEWFKEHSYKED